MKGRRWRGPVLVATTFIAGWLLALALLGIREARAQDGFDFLTWELRTLPNRLLYTLGTPWRDDPSADDAIRGYFSSERTSAQARHLENTVEAAIERRLADVIDAAGIDSFGPDLPVLGVFPPVDFELAASPRVLVRSPRDDIRRLDTFLLRPDLPLGEALALEAAAEEHSPAVSALVVPSGGIAAYPAVVSQQGSYRAVVATAAHEWIHHYLAFYPLGRAYASSAEGRTINETVADLVGDELAAEVLRRWGDPTTTEARATPEAMTAEASTLAPPQFDAAPVLRELRLEVDALLAAGDVATAEQRMEAVRRDLAREGVEIRRINQAYFAWYGTYAAREDATDPLGEQLRALRAQSGSLDSFLVRVRSLTNREAVADALAQADN